MGDLTIKISDYLPGKRIEEIAEEEIRLSFRRQVSHGQDLERVLSNTCYQFCKMLEEEIRNARPLIREAVEKRIKEYPFHELDRDEIGGVIYDMITGKLFGGYNKAQGNAMEKG